MPATMRVHGEATLSVAPDRAEMDISVVTQATNSKDATDRNSVQSRALIEKLNATLPSNDVKTINFSVNPNYRYSQNGPATTVGYTANNTVRVLLTDLGRLQTVIDIAVKAGASSISRLNFSLSNETAVRDEALAKAADQAKSSADALANSLKVRLQRLVNVEQGQPIVVSPPREIVFEKLQSTNLAPVSPGVIDVHADVDLTYEIVPSTPQQ